MRWTRRRLLTATVGVGTISLSGCLDFFRDDDRALPETPTGTWRQAAHDVRNTGVADVSVPDRGTPAWSGGDSTTIPPLIAEETVYTVGDGLTALETKTGERQWQIDFDSDSPSASLTQPAVADGQLLIGSEGWLRSFDTADGSERWSRTIEGAPIGPVAVDADRRIGLVPFERPREADAVVELVAFDVSSGEIEWTAPILASVRTTPPAVFDGRVYASGYTRDDAPILRCFAADDGELVWERDLEDPVTPPAAVDEGIVLGDGGDVLVYEPTEGERLATIDVTNREISGIAVADGTAFVLSQDGLVAVSVPEGSKQWSVAGDPRAGGLAVGRATVVAPITADAFDLDTSWPCIGAFDRSDGTVRWYHAIDGDFDPAIGAPPVVADGAVLAVSNANSGVTALGDLSPRDE